MREERILFVQTNAFIFIIFFSKSCILQIDAQAARLTTLESKLKTHHLRCTENGDCRELQIVSKERDNLRARLAVVSGPLHSE